jgi:hypothetical protein
LRQRESFFFWAKKPLVYTDLYADGLSPFEKRIRPVRLPLVETNHGEPHPAQDYYIQYSISGKVRRVSTQTTSLELAKEKLRQVESAQLRGDDSPLPTRSPLPQILAVYVQHLRATKRPKSAQTDIYYLGHMFGPVCTELEITSRVVTEACLKRKPRPGVDGRRRALLIEAPSLEQISTPQISAFLAARPDAGTGAQDPDLVLGAAERQ